MANAYDVGDKIRLKATFTDASSNAVDPTTITLTVKDPSGNTNTYTYSGATVTKSATGIYYTDLSVDEAGDWWYRYEGTGTGEAAGEETFWARTSRF